MSATVAARHSCKRALAGAMWTVYVRLVDRGDGREVHPLQDPRERRAVGRSWPGGPRPTPTTPGRRQGKRARRARDHPTGANVESGDTTAPVGTAAHPGGQVKT
eukprot:647406-Prorocentrum_minimum.AAC.1